MRTAWLVALLVIGFPVLPGGAGPVHAGVALQLVTQAASPTHVWHADDDRLFILERAGTIRVYKPGQGLLATPFLDLTAKVLTEGERGLFAIAFHPDFQTNGLFYVSYYGREPDHGDIVARYKVSDTDPDVADPASERIVFTVPKSSGAHNGGQIAIRPADHHLYLSVGDGGHADSNPVEARAEDDAR